MSFQGYNVIACVPAGRRRVLDPLLKHLRCHRDIIDQVNLWQNTTDNDDLKWMRDQVDDYVNLIPLDEEEPPRTPKQLNTGRFYRNATDPHTLYIRFDDDIVWIHADAIENLLTARLENPDPFVVFATIWNNAIISSLAQTAGIVNGGFGRIEKYCMDPIGWKSDEFGEYVHNLLLHHIYTGTTESLYLEDVEAINILQRSHGPVKLPLRFSVSCFAWFGADMADVADELWEVEEEQFISSVYPERTQRWNLINGNSLVSHYSFFTQRPHLDRNTTILAQYQQLADDAYHDAYYRLLGEAE